MAGPVGGRPPLTDGAGGIGEGARIALFCCEMAGCESAGDDVAEAKSPRRI
jgi:hypothetical protein